MKLPESESEEKEHNANTFDATLAKRLLSTFHGDLNPMACFIGGLAAQ